MRRRLEETDALPSARRYRWSMELEPGDVAPRIGLTIIGACVVTVAIAFVGMQAMWEGVEWVEDPWFVGVPSPGRSHFWYTCGLGFAMCAALALAYVPRFRLSKLLRVAIVLPIFQVAAIAVAAYVWSIFDADALAKMSRDDMGKYFTHVSVPLPTIGALAIGFVSIVAIAIAIRRRHGEWAHASMMLALSYLLLLGLWLPLVARLAVRSQESNWSWRDITVRVLDAKEIVPLATIPPAIVAVAFVVLVFRAPRLFERIRRQIRIATWSLLVLAIIVAVSLPDKGWLVYLESSYLVMSAVVFAVAALVLLACASWLRLLRAQRPSRSTRSRKLVYEEGQIATDDAGEVARFEITSWLRGPQLVKRPFVVTTKHGNIPIAGANVVVRVPAVTTLLDVGEHAAALRPGARVVIAGRRAESGGHPFRANDATEIALVSTPDVRANRLSDLTLVVWRPAVAYLTILVAVAAPFLSIFLTS